MTTMARSDIASAKPRRCREGVGECMRVPSSGAVPERDGDYERIAIVVLRSSGHTYGILGLRFRDDVDARYLRRRRRDGARRIAVHEAKACRSRRRRIGEIRSGDRLNGAADASRALLVAEVPRSRARGLIEFVFRVA